MSSENYTFTAKVWLYPGESAAWHFISVPKTFSTTIKDRHAHEVRGWGSHKVSATIGSTTWTTSIFPDARSGMYLLPLKADIRKREAIYEGDTVSVVLRVV